MAAYDACEASLSQSQSRLVSLNASLATASAGAGGCADQLAAAQASLASLSANASTCSASLSSALSAKAAADANAANDAVQLDECSAALNSSRANATADEAALAVAEARLLLCGATSNLQSSVTDSLTQALDAYTVCHGQLGTCLAVGAGLSGSLSTCQADLNATEAALHAGPTPTASPTRLPVGLPGSSMTATMTPAPGAVSVPPLASHAPTNEVHGSRVCRFKSINYYL
jgi:hypothetical protein